MKMSLYCTCPDEWAGTERGLGSDLPRTWVRTIIESNVGMMMIPNFDLDESLKYSNFKLTIEVTAAMPGQRRWRVISQKPDNTPTPIRRYQRYVPTSWIKAVPNDGPEVDVPIYGNETYTPGQEVAISWTIEKLSGAARIAMMGNWDPDTLDAVDALDARKGRRDVSEGGE
jgi:hypothetical protein